MVHVMVVHAGVVRRVLAGQEWGLGGPHAVPVGAHGLSGALLFNSRPKDVGLPVGEGTPLSLPTAVTPPSHASAQAHPPHPPQLRPPLCLAQEQEARLAEQQAQAQQGWRAGGSDTSLPKDVDPRRASSTGIDQAVKEAFEASAAAAKSRRVRGWRGHTCARG